MPLYHNDEENRLLQVTSTLNRANSMAFLTDATVAAADTKAGLKAAINATSVHADQEGWKIMLTDAIDVSGLADSDILSLTTVAGLIALLPANTSSLILE